MNTEMYIDVPTNSEEAWQAFALAHGMDHDTVAAAIIQKGFAANPQLYPLYDFPRLRNGDYLYAHYQVHLANATALNITDLPDLSTADFSNPEQVSDWLDLHQQVHLAENQVLGLQ